MLSPNPTKRARDLRVGDEIIHRTRTLRIASINAYPEPYAPGGFAVIIRTFDGTTLPGTWETIYTLPLIAAA
ncbi:MAG TPA: hypothetical protein VNF68_11600 [Candidatus Baltobacteraceae bacterium]|nr:hypothetical protein [Candidatus Baltobacteraceae bacterium]